jgi:hypothetical protein
MGKVGGGGMDPEAAEKEEAAEIRKYASRVYAAYCGKNRQERDPHHVLPSTNESIRTPRRLVSSGWFKETSHD